MPGNGWLSSNSTIFAKIFFIRFSAGWLISNSTIFAKIFFIGFSSPVKGHLVSQPTSDVSSRGEILGLQKLNIYLFIYVLGRSHIHWKSIDIYELLSILSQYQKSCNLLPYCNSYVPFLQSFSTLAPNPHPCAETPSSTPANYHFFFSAMWNLQTAVLLFSNVKYANSRFTFQQWNVCKQQAMPPLCRI